MTGRFAMLGGFVLLLGAWWWSSRTPPEKEAPAPSKTMLGLAEDDVHSLRIQWQDKEPVVLRRNGTYWTLPNWNNYPADQTYANVLFRTLLTMPWGEVVSVPENKDAYGLSPAKRQVDLYNAQGSPVGSLLVGNPVGDYRTAFVRLPGSSRVRRVKADLIPSLSRISWARRSVWRLSESLIHSVTAAGFNNDFVVQREQEGGQWQLHGPVVQTLNDAFFTELLPFLIHPKAGNVIFEPEADFPVHASLRLKTSLTEMVLELGDLDGEIIQVRYADEPVIYQFSPRIRQLVARAVTTEISGDGR